MVYLRKKKKKKKDWQGSGQTCGLLHISTSVPQTRLLLSVATFPHTKLNTSLTAIRTLVSRLPLKTMLGLWFVRNMY